MAVTWSYQKRLDVPVGAADKIYCEGACDSQDTKPTANIAEGSIIVETDTGDVYLFNEGGTSWVKQFSLQAL